MKWSSVKSLICPAICLGLCVLQVMTYHQLRDLQATNARLHKAIGFDDEKARQSQYDAGTLPTEITAALDTARLRGPIQQRSRYSDAHTAHLHDMTLKEMLQDAGYSSVHDYLNADNYDTLLDDDMTEDERRMHTEAVRAWQNHAFGAARMPFEGELPGGYRMSHFSRRLGALMTYATTNTATLGCLGVSLTASASVDVSSATCSNSAKCPPCFALSNDGSVYTYTVQNAGSHIVGSSAISNQVIQVDFINIHASVAVVIDSGSSNKFTLGPYQAATAYVVAGTDVLMFPSYHFCPSGCDASAPKDEDNTAFSTCTGTCGISR